MAVSLFPRMKLQSLATLVALVHYALGFPHLMNFPEYRSLAGLSPQEVRAVERSFSQTPGAQPLPPPINDTSAKLVYDAAHPYIPDQSGDIRGPCPGLNTLASHGYLPHNGVATPAHIITAVQEGFNMGWGLAAFLTYGAFVVDGNHLTNLMSIGANTTAEDELTPGLNIHGISKVCDASTTRGDLYLGNKYSFNETLFDQVGTTFCSYIFRSSFFSKLVDAANLVGDGYITVDSAALQKYQRINNSMETNPTFSFDTPRFLTAYAEASFPLAFFVSKQTVNTTVNVTLENARSFFQDHKYPDGFYRRQAPYDFNEVSVMFDTIFNLIGVLPGHNEGVGNYVRNPDDNGSTCYAYQRQLNLTAQLYPLNPTSELETAIKDQFGHILSDARRSDLRTTLSIWTVRHLLVEI
ncbi:heme-thiolate peroxidase [Chiua virens]|nr:heme-thiolate peroxidase [Chiua virens]